LISNPPSGSVNAWRPWTPEFPVCPQTFLAVHHRHLSLIGTVYHLISNHLQKRPSAKQQLTNGPSSFFAVSSSMPHLPIDHDLDFGDFGFRY
jgi:hypothetical protein